MANNLTYTVNLKINDAALKGLISALGAYNTSVNQSNKATVALEKELAGVGTAGGKAATGINSANKALADTTSKAASASKAADDLNSKFEGIANTRYAMYDVATSLGVVSVATLGLSVAAIKTSADFEQLFASVQRTSQTSGSEWAGLKKSLIDISTEIPVTAQSISEIATLGGQLGIQAQNIDAFTESVAKFSATTDVSAQAAAEGLGRLAQLSGAGQNSFDELTSSIYQVGVTSVATESAVLAVATQISVSARQAGFAADQTIALAGALASLGVAPERARGSIQRVFNIITNAADNGGAKLEAFAQTAGVTAQQFAQTWKGDPQTAFQQFLAGLGRADAAGQNMNNILSEVGISAVRDTDALKRLAQNTDVYSDAIAQANSGWNDGSVFANGYAVQTETLNAKIQVLTQTLKAMIAAAQNNGALKLLVDILQAFASSLQSVADNKAVQWLTGFVVVLGLIIGVLAAVGAGVALAVASMLALLTVTRQLTVEQQKGVTTFGLARIALHEYALGMGRASEADLAKILTTNGVTTASERLGATLRVLNATTRATSIAFKGLLASVAIGAAFVALGVVFEKWTASAEAAKKTKEDLDASFKEAVDIDVKAYIAAGGVLKQLPDDLAGSSDAADAAGQHASELGKTMVGLDTDIGSTSDTVVDATNKLYDLTDALGAATDESVRKNVLSLALGDGDGTEQLKQIQQIQAAMEALGFSWDDVVNAVKNHDDAFLNNLKSTAQTAIVNAGTMGSAFDVSDPLYNSTLALVDFSDKTLVASDSLYATTKGSEAMQYGASALGVTLTETGDDADDFSDATVDLSKGLFDSSNATIGMTNAMNSLGSQLYDTGGGFDALTVNGAANMGAFQDAVSAAAKIAGDDSNLFIAMIDNIISQMVASGVTGVEQLRIVRNQYASITGGIPTSSDDLRASSLLAGQLATGMHKAAQETKNVGKNAAGAKKEIRTLADYVSDLKKVFKDAFDFRFGLGQAVDDSASAFRKIQDAFADARDKANDLTDSIAELHATLLSLSADKSILEYQLTVAQEYGDTLRASEIQAELAKNAADTSKAQNDLTKQTSDLTKAQEAANPSLTGNTEAAADQRKAVLDLVSSYEDQITAYAAAGHSVQQIAAYSKQLKAQFEAQMRQLGYNTAETKKYSAAFNDLAKIIAKVPRNLTVAVSANTNPAQVALDQFFAKNANKTLTTTQKVVSDYSTDRKGAAESSLNSQIDLLGRQIRATSNPNLLAALGTALKPLLAKRMKLYGYADGGYTGPGGKYAPAGVVHKGEYVIESERVNALGVPFLNALGRSTERGYSSGGPVSVSASVPGSMMVELSPTDRRLLAAAGLNPVYLDSKEITKAVNKNNAVTGARGIQ